MKRKSKAPWVIVGVLVLCAIASIVRNFTGSLCSAEARLDVLPEAGGDVAGRAGARGMLPKDMEYLDRLAVATWMSSRRTHQMLLEREDIRSTAWFAAHGSNVDSALEDLSRRCRAMPQRYESHITVSMQAERAEDAGLIVNALATMTVEALDQRTQQADPAEETGLPRVTARLMGPADRPEPQP